MYKQNETTPTSSFKPLTLCMTRNRQKSQVDAAHLGMVNSSKNSSDNLQQNYQDDDDGILHTHTHEKNIYNDMNILVLLHQLQLTFVRRNRTLQGILFLNFRKYYFQKKLGYMIMCFYVWIGGIVVRVLDLRLEIAGSIPAAALSSATLDKLSSASEVTILWCYINQF